METDMRSNGKVELKNLPKIAVYFLVVAGLLITPALAQERTGEINGNVSDQTGAVLPGVSVTLTNTGTGRVMTILTSDDGSYHARALQPGRYAVKFELSGFVPAEFKDVQLLVGQALK